MSSFDIFVQSDLIPLAMCLIWVVAELFNFSYFEVDFCWVHLEIFVHSLIPIAHVSNCIKIRPEVAEIFNFSYLEVILSDYLCTPWVDPKILKFKSNQWLLRYLTSYSKVVFRWRFSSVWGGLHLIHWFDPTFSIEFE